MASDIFDGLEMHEPSGSSAFWKPSVDDFLRGRVTVKDEHTFPQTGDVVPQLHVLVESGTSDGSRKLEPGSTIRATLTHAGLAGQVADAGVEVGDTVALRRKPDLPGSRAFQYEVAVGKSPPENDDGRYDPDYIPPPDDKPPHDPSTAPFSEGY